jgi:hypothetical protein
MRIGVITYHWVANFGANLQALATTRWLASRGHDVLLVDYRPPALIDKYRSTVPEEQFEAHQAFCRGCLPLTATFQTQAELRAAASDLDLGAAFTGSDAVFRLDYRLGREDTTFPNPFWLDWVPGSNVVTGSIAASAMGTNFLGLPRDIRRGVRERLTAMEHVTVRDYWTQLMVLLVTAGRVRAGFLPDPVMILGDVFDFDGVSDETTHYGEPYILLGTPTRLLDEDWVGGLVADAHRRGVAVIGLPMPEGDCAPGPLDWRVPVPLDPVAWYRWIAGARGYIGVRFHPIVVAMACGVPFVSLDLYQKRGYPPFVSKTFDMTFRAGLSRRCLSMPAFRRLAPSAALSLLLDSADKHQMRQLAFRRNAAARYGACKWL